MKKLISLFLISISTLTYSQSISSVKTEYSQIEKETIGKESFTFSLYNSYITIKDNYYDSSIKYGPLYLNDSGYKENYYFESFLPNIKADPLSFGSRKEIIAYRFVYKKKGGTILYIDQMKMKNKQLSKKTFYTNEGFNDSNPLNEDAEIKANFDIRDVIINSYSMTDLVGRINFSFEQNGNKQKSDDGQFVTVRYDNKSNVTPLVSYSKTGETKKIIFLVPKGDADKVIKEMIIKYGTKEIKGEELIIRGDLTYDYRADGQIGIIIIY